LHDAVHLIRDQYITQHRDRSATLFSIYRDRKLINTLSTLYRDTRKAQSNSVPGRQKARRASLLSAGTGTLHRFNFTAPAFIHSATFTHFIAGPLAQIFEHQDFEFAIPLSLIKFHLEN
jgi:hypothetical protein